MAEVLATSTCLACICGGDASGLAHGDAGGLEPGGRHGRPSDCRFSDNFLHLDGGEVTITAIPQEHLDLAAFQKRLKA